MSSYALLGGVPLALLTGAPVSTVLDLALGLAIPIHSHIAMRAVFVDYMPHVGITTAEGQALCMYILSGVTVVMAFGLAKFNLTDLGISGAVKRLWTNKKPAEAGSSAVPTDGAAHPGRATLAAAKKAGSI